MSNIYDQVPVPEYLGEGEGSLDEVLELERETPSRTRRLTVRQFCRGVLHSREYRESLSRRIDSDSLPAQIETLLYSYAYGKPVERVEFNDVTENNLEGKSVEELLAKRAKLEQKLRAIEQKTKFDELSTDIRH